jgi:uncharacterized repeat protein (TIGR03803 family)
MASYHHRALLRAAVFFSLITTPALAAGSLNTLYKFPSGANGDFPRGGLAMDGAGNLYGTTRYDGNCSTCGIIYKLVPPSDGSSTWTYSVLHDFELDDGGGIDPSTPLTYFKGVLYGTAQGGGDQACGCGTVFSITPGGKYTLLHTFDPSDESQGATPTGGLLIASDGTMYGTTSTGGANDSGIVYKLSTSGGGFQILKSFDNYQGNPTAGPSGELIFGKDGAIYGTTYGGGLYDQGVIFRMTTGGSYLVLYNFKGVNQPGNSSDGAQPEGRLALGPDGTIYGTTGFGGSPSGYGTAWSIKQNGSTWDYKQLYIFGSPGNLPHSGLILGNDGDLYGTGAGGGNYQSGVIYRFLPPATANGTWTYQLLHSFIGRDPNGDDPTADLLYANGKFYGTNLTGGDITDCPSAPGGCGTVFMFSPTITPHDFNGDALSDVLFRQNTGKVVVWEMNGAQVKSYVNSDTAATSWQVAGSGDFDGDGFADILWRNSNGQVAVWLMNGGKVKSSKTVGSASSDWKIVGTGDFDGDGKTDILWHQTSTGKVAIWKMNGTNAPTFLNPGYATTDWQVAGVGDFDGDGTADIVWRNTNGHVAVWLMQDGKIKKTATVGTATSAWTIAGTGDFDGDGRDDILLHNSNGQVAIWLMNGTQVKSYVNSATATTDWQIATTGDIDGDGKADIVWRNTNGKVAVWLMNGGKLKTTKVVGSATGVWTIQPQ